eukprot:TRINITY_DN8986_c0_g1_i1.p1 TRINITY_DN8986_c0_g1~~TRINITY_DN8986_c0_g1_i1.p1  ORF type:complete len:736 (-),score=184.45 TRINITY_DN8986_c0_g1_i1:34-2241(-)
MSMSDEAVVLVPLIIADPESPSSTNAPTNISEDNLRQLSGVVRLDMENGDSFEGELNQGEKEGFGVYKYATGTTYQGAYSGGRKHGYGVLTYHTGEKYEGDWRGGKQHGKGKFVSAHGNLTYVGDWADGVRHGYGTNVKRFGDSADLETYSGEWHNGLQTGRGRLTYRNRDEYTGEFLNGLPDGTGTLITADGGSYTGQWHNGVKHGHGVVASPDGSSFEGEFTNNCKSHGLYRGADGSEYDEIWSGSMVLQRKLVSGGRSSSLPGEAGKEKKGFAGKLQSLKRSITSVMATGRLSKSGRPTSPSSATTAAAADSPATPIRKSSDSSDQASPLAPSHETLVFRSDSFSTHVDSNSGDVYITANARAPSTSQSNSPRVTALTRAAAAAAAASQVGSGTPPLRLTPVTPEHVRQMSTAADDQSSPLRASTPSAFGVSSDTQAVVQLQRLYADSIADNVALKNQLQKASSMRESLRESLEANNEALRTQLSATERRMQQILSESRSYARDVAELRTKQHEQALGASERVQKLESELRTSQQALESIPEVEARLALFEGRIAEMATEQDLLLHTLAMAQDSLADRDADLVRMSSMNRSPSDPLSLLSDVLQHSKQTLLEEISSLRERLSAARREKTEFMQEAHQQKDVLEKQILQLNEELHERDARTAQIRLMHQQTLSQVQAENRQLMQQVEAAEARAAAAELQTAMVLDDMLQQRLRAMQLKIAPFLDAPDASTGEK